MNSTTRIDVAMAARGLTASRERAQALIMSGVVYVKEQKVLKPSEMIAPEDEILVRGAKAHPYVSRGGLKLEKALQAFNLNVTGLTALDIGAATGGFTDVLLQNGASACDRRGRRLRAAGLEIAGRSARDGAGAHQRALPDGGDPWRPRAGSDGDGRIVHLREADPSNGRGADAERGIFCILIKPQFEAGRDKVGKHGVVRDSAIRIAVIRDIRDFAVRMDYSMINLDFSPDQGSRGEHGISGVAHTGTGATSRRLKTPRLNGWF